MEIAKFVEIDQELLKLLSENDVKIGDWKYIKLYEEYKCMRQKSIKYRYAVAHLAATHNMSRAKVERIIRRLSKDVK